MRYRRLSAADDYTFGQGSANFLVDSPATVAQSILTRLRLWEGEWFLDTTEGTPWLQKILGAGHKAIYDLAITTRVLETRGVTGIENYESVLTPARRLQVSMNVVTEFSEEPINVEAVV